MHSEYVDENIAALAAVRGAGRLTTLFDCSAITCIGASTSLLAPIGLQLVGNQTR